MTLLILCVMLCIVGPLPKVSALPSSDLEGKVEKLEFKLEAMSTVIFRLIKENEELIKKNEKLEAIADTVPILIRENEKLKTVDDSFFKENELLKSRVSFLEEMVQDGVGRKDEWSYITDDKATMDKPKNQDVMKLADEFGMQDEEEDSKRSDHRIQQNRKRLLVSPTSSATGVVAFHSYVSKDNLGQLPAHHILKFDSVSLNKGQGYNAYDGIFVTPTSGTYVFTWSMMAIGHGNVYTQLMKNADIVGTRYVDSTDVSDWNFSTGIVVLDVNQGDHIYVQLGRASVGDVVSTVYSRATFSGWLLN